MFKRKAAVSDQNKQLGSINTWVADELSQTVRASASAYERTQLTKVEEAKMVIAECRNEDGFHASERRYPELWLRDMVYSEEVLLGLGYAETVKKHLSGFIKLQREDGRIPTVITTPLRRVLEQKFPSLIADTEILFVIGMKKYDNFTHDQFFKDNEKQVQLTIGFIESKLDKHGFIPGIDWRDAMSTCGGKFLLANQMHLIEMWDLLGEHERADSLKKQVNKYFYSEERGFYADAIYWKEGKLEQNLHFDSLGNSLAILNGTVPKEATESIVKAFDAVKTQFGYMNSSPPYKIDRLRLLSSTANINAFVRNGAILRNRPYNYQNSAIWPFIEAKVIEALRKGGAIQQAEEARRVMLEREDLNEFYSPITGEPKGSAGQLWTAVAVLQSSA